MKKIFGRYGRCLGTIAMSVGLICGAVDVSYATTSDSSMAVGKDFDFFESCGVGPTIQKLAGKSLITMLRTIAFKDGRPDVTKTRTCLDAALANQSGVLSNIRDGDDTIDLAARLYDLLYGEMKHHEILPGHGENWNQATRWSQVGGLLSDTLNACGVPVASESGSSLKSTQEELVALTTFLKKPIETIPADFENKLEKCIDVLVKMCEDVEDTRVMFF